MLMLGADKKKIGDAIVKKMVNGKEEYSTGPKEYSDSAKLCAHELIKAVEQKDPNKIISAFIALSHEVESMEEEKEGPELEIKF
jgi:hypothetical protein